MTPELLCFITSMICAIFIILIEIYYILNITHYKGNVIPLIEVVVDKIYDKKNYADDELDPMDIV